MKTKIIIVLISVSLIVFLVLYYNLEMATGQAQPSSIKVESSKSESTSKVENLDISEVPQEARKVHAEDIQVIATTSNEAEKLASQFYNEIFSIVGLEEDFIHNVEAGQPIDVSNFYDDNEPPSQFIPLYSNNRVVGVSIFREYHEGKKELGRMSEIREEWHSYPPVKDYDAQFVIDTNYPTLAYTRMPGYYHIEDGETPYFAYEGNDGGSIKYYLVSAYSKNVIVKKDRAIFELVEEKPPVRLSEKGIMELDDSMVFSLSNEELKQLKSDIELTNKYIEEGLLKFDHNMNVIYDKRNSNIESNNVFSSEEPTYHSDNSIFDDDKINDSSETTVVIE